MRNLSTFNYNHHPSRVKMVAKFIRRGIRVILNGMGFWFKPGKSVRLKGNMSSVHDFQTSTPDLPPYTSLGIPFRYAEREGWAPPTADAQGASVQSRDGLERVKPNFMK